EVHSFGSQSKSERIGMLVLTSRRNMRSARARVDRSASYLSVKIRTSNVQRLRAVAIQEVGTGSAKSWAGPLETRDALDSSPAFGCRGTQARLRVPSRR